MNFTAIDNNGTVDGFCIIKSIEKRISSKGDTYLDMILGDKDGEIIEVACDNVIVSIGYDSAPLVKKARHIHIVGDAHKIGNLRTVIWQAWDVAMKL